MANVIEELKKRISDAKLWSRDFSIKRNEFLLKSGAKEKYLYFIEEGALRVYITKEDEEQVIRFGYPGSIITGLDSFLSGNPTIFYIQAIKQCRLKGIEVKTFNEFIHSSPQHIGLYLNILKAFVIQQMEREEDLLTASPEERYKRVLKRSPHLFQEIPNKYIASYLRMAPETLSRLKKS